jgi:membrane protease YdiL (CAAX protease family)
MLQKTLNVKSTMSGKVIAILIFSIFITLAYALHTDDSMYFLYALMTMTYLIWGALQDKGSAEKNLKTMHWGTQNLSYVIPIGILTSLSCIGLGSILMSLNFFENASLITPNVNGLESLVTGTIFANAGFILIISLIAQIFIVGVAEESGFRALLPAMFMQFTKNAIIAFFLAICVWSGYHYFNWVKSGTPFSMYLVLILWGIIFVIILALTQNLLAPIIAHGLTNVFIMLVSAGFSPIKIAIFYMLVSALFLYNHHSEKEINKTLNWELN